MKKTKIYIVIGTTGEYSDRREWLVNAYKDKRLAECHVTNATARAKEIELKIQNEDIDYEDREALYRTNKYDECMDMQYTGTHYYMSECELLTE